MIYIYNGFKFKTKNSHSSDSLLKKLSVTDVEDRELLDKKFECGDDIIGFINNDILFLCDTKQKAEDDYWLTMDEI